MVSPEKFVLLDSDTFTWVLNAIVSDALFNGNKVGNGTFHFLKNTRPFREEFISRNEITLYKNRYFQCHSSD